MSGTVRGIMLSRRDESRIMAEDFGQDLARALGIRYAENQACYVLQPEQAKADPPADCTQTDFILKSTDRFSEPYRAYHEDFEISVTVRGIHTELRISPAPESGLAASIANIHSAEVARIEEDGDATFMLLKGNRLVEHLR